MYAKQFLIPAALLLFLSIQAVAQVSIKVGVNIASIAESAAEDTYRELENKSVVGLQAGLAFDVAPQSMISIQPELLFIQKGGKVAYGLDDNNRIENRYYYNYLEVPVLAKLKLGIGENRTGIFLLAGPYVGMAFSGKVKQKVTFLGQTTTSEDKFTFDNDDPDERNRRLDWGLSFGGGLKVGAIYVDLRYNLGINNLVDNDASNQNDNKPYRRNRGIGIAVGYEF